jgi:hypothetical protein
MLAGTFDEMVGRPMRRDPWGPIDGGPGAVAVLELVGD